MNQIMELTGRQVLEVIQELNLTYDLEVTLLRSTHHYFHGRYWIGFDKDTKEVFIASETSNKPRVLSVKTYLTRLDAAMFRLQIEDLNEALANTMNEVAQ